MRDNASANLGRFTLAQVGNRREQVNCPIVRLPARGWSGPRGVADHPRYGQEAGEEAAVAEALRAGPEEASQEPGLLGVCPGRGVDGREVGVARPTWLLFLHCSFHWLEPSRCCSP